MDRGVKIAIFVASVVSLGLGLIWDQVLSRARDVVAAEKTDSMGPERIKARVGPKDLQRQELPTDMAEVNAAPKPADLKAESSPSKPEAEASKPAAQPSAEFTEYVVKEGDSWWIIANRRFKDRGYNADDLSRLNNNVALRPNVKVKIPVSKKPA